MLSPRVLILAGGLSHEREVSLRSGSRVAEALRESGCEVTVRDVDDQLLDTLRSGHVDVVWPLLHGVSGEDGAVRDVLELVGVPYVAPTRPPVGCPGTSRWLKAWCRRSNSLPAVRRPTPRHLPGARCEPSAQLHRRPAWPAPGGQAARGGSALGASAVREASALPRAMVDCFAYGDVAMVEQQVAGVEVSVTVLDTGSGPVALPPVEIVPDSGLYDYDARYVAGATEFFCPARLSDETLEAVKAAALAAHKVFGLRHVSRTD